MRCSSQRVVRLRRLAWWLPCRRPPPHVPVRAAGRSLRRPRSRRRHRSHRGSVSAAASFPVTVHAANGRVTISREPTRIVSVSPTATEDLFAIGAGEQVTAVDKNSGYPTAAPHTRLDSYQLNVEAIANYRPDLVVAPA
jgi:ABC-type Fe3+-hydroxamate transport system substrate-binding protein